MKGLCATAAAAVLTCSISGCGSSGDSPTAPSPPPPANTLTIQIARDAGSQSFVPNPASPGDRLVVFTNNDSVVHRVRLNDGSYDTGDLLPGQSSQPRQMPAAGANYHCPLHPGMIGTVNASSGAEAPPCEDPLYCD